MILPPMLVTEVQPADVCTDFNHEEWEGTDIDSLFKKTARTRRTRKHGVNIETAFDGQNYRGIVIHSID
jgi:hypothetical protein